MSCFQLQDVDLERSSGFETQGNTPEVPGAAHIPPFPMW